MYLWVVSHANMAESESEYALGDHRGRTYTLRYRARPGWNAPEDWAAVVYYTDDAGDEVQIVRIDTSNGYTHIDQLYRRDNDKPAFDGDLWDAIAYLEDRWRTYANSFHELSGDS